VTSSFGQKLKLHLQKKNMLRHSQFAFLHRRLKPEQSYKKLSYQIVLDANTI
jgi:hypothetical protein